MFFIPSLLNEFTIIICSRQQSKGIVSENQGYNDDKNLIIVSSLKVCD